MSLLSLQPHVPRWCLVRGKNCFSTHRHAASTNPAHPVSVPIRHPSDKSSAVTSFETDIYLHRICNKIPGTYAVYSCVWRLGCFPRAWRRGSWHFHVASLHLQSIMNLCPLHTFFPSEASVAGSLCRPRSEAPCIYYCIYTRGALPRWDDVRLDSAHARNYRGCII